MSVQHNENVPETETKQRSEEEGNNRSKYQSLNTFAQEDGTGNSPPGSFGARMNKNISDPNLFFSDVLDNSPDISPSASVPLTSVTQ